jgi:SAM-dependent methyltransferase
MISDEYRIMAEKEAFHWWFVSRRHFFGGILKRYLRPRESRQSILDIGCGTGGNLPLLSRFGPVTGLDISDEALRFCQNKGFQKLIKGSAEQMPFPDNSFDLAGCFDVLEHLDNDSAAIGEIQRLLRPGGLALIAVPAFQCLWCPQDEYLHHRRRYSKKELIKKLKSVGLKILASDYFIIPTVPVIILVRFMERLLSRGRRPHSYDFILPRPINAFMIFLMRLEELWRRFLPLPLGSSLYVLVQKPL